MRILFRNGPKYNIVNYGLSFKGPCKKLTKLSKRISLFKKNVCGKSIQCSSEREIIIYRGGVLVSAFFLVQYFKD